MQRFIVGTGRCGSTLLSKMIRENAAVTSIFEYLNGLDGALRFSAEPVSGAAFTAMLCAVHPFLKMVLERGYPVEEVTYPFDAPGARFPRDALPWILGTTLPELRAGPPDALYDELRALTLAFPARPAAAQHEALFDWLVRRTGGRVWVERSGAAIDYLGSLAALYPEAHFVHIHRAGEDAALSMREHHAFRLAIMLAYQIPAGTGRSRDELEAFARREEEQDHVRALLDSRPEPAFFGRWWTDQVRRGDAARAKLEADRYREVRFEDLIERPRETLAGVARFLELPDPEGEWLGRAAALVRGMPPSRLAGLPAAERDALVAACRPGNALLGRA